MAATFGYLVFLIRVTVSGRPRVVERVSHAGADGADVLDLVNAALDNVGTGFHRDGSDEGFRCKERVLEGRSIWLRINKGPAGIGGETYNMDTDESTETTEREALLSGLRAMLFLPENSYYGLMFVERIGRRNLKQLLENWVWSPVMYELRESIVRIEGFAEASDWQLLLANKELLQVSEVLKSTSGDDESTPIDRTVKVTITGGSIRAATERVKSMVVNRAARRTRRVELIAASSDLNNKHVATPDAFTVEDKARLDNIENALAEIDSAEDREVSLEHFLDQLNPVDRTGEGLAHSSYDVALGERRPERVFSVERDSIPQFVYETAGRRLGDTQLKNTWIDHAESILRNRGVTLSTGWAKKDLPTESTPNESE